MAEEYSLLEVLQNIDPSRLNYQGWVNVGMALKEEGYSAADWERWSMRDAGRYHQGECLRKWGSFNGAADRSYRWQENRGGARNVTQALNWNGTASSKGIRG